MSICGFILAAGEGRRLRPATLTTPKALVPFCGISLLDLAVHALQEAGMNTMVVNACYLANHVESACDSLRQETGLDLRVSHETTLLNQGGGLRRGATLCPEATDFLVHNVDIISDYDIRELIRIHQRSNADITVLLIPNRGPQTVSLHPDGTIRTFRDREHGAYTFAGIHLFKRPMLDYLDDTEAPDIIDAYQRALDDGRTIRTVVASPRVYWSDIGTPQSYIQAHGDIMDCALSHHARLRLAQSTQSARRAAMEASGVLCTGAIGLGENIHVAAGAQLHNVVLWDNTDLQSQLLYADGIITGNTVTTACILPPVQRTPDARIFQALGMDPSQTALTPLKKQGSGRNYQRLSDGKQSWIWCAYNPERRENAGFVAISEFLARLGIPVPTVRLHLADSFEIISQDLGQNDISELPAPLQEHYLKQVIEYIARLHILGATAAHMEELPLQKSFTKGLYDWERDYFRNNLLDNCLHAPELWSDAADDYCTIRAMLLQQPLVPIHRDCQSANVKALDGKAYLIDFQGMRLGAAAYDVASLLYDPYQCYSKKTRNALWHEYTRCVRQLKGRPPTAAILHAAACQRLMQALGAYAKLWLKDGLSDYRRYILPALDMLVQAATEAGCFKGFLKMAQKAREKALESNMLSEQ